MKTLITIMILVFALYFSGCATTQGAFDFLSKGTKQVGFYSYGEISPYFSGGCDLHNQTMTLTTITER